MQPPGGRGGPLGWSRRVSGLKLTLTPLDKAAWDPGDLDNEKRSSSNEASERGVQENGRDPRVRIDCGHGCGRLIARRKAIVTPVSFVYSLVPERVSGERGKARKCAAPNGLSLRSPRCCCDTCTSPKRTWRTVQRENLSCGVLSTTR